VRDDKGDARQAITHDRPRGQYDAASVAARDARASRDLPLQAGLKRLAPRLNRPLKPCVYYTRCSSRWHTFMISLGCMHVFLLVYHPSRRLHLESEMSRIEPVLSSTKGNN
jgi:hypothetical protein